MSSLKLEAQGGCRHKLPNVIICRASSKVCLLFIKHIFTITIRQIMLSKCYHVQILLKNICEITLSNDLIGLGLIINFVFKS